MKTIRSQRALAKALADLAGRDADIARALDIAGPPPIRRRAHGFETLLQIIVGQQLSVASARAIWRRLATACEPLTPATVLALDATACKAIGLSRQKHAYARTLAEVVLDGGLDIAALAGRDDEDAIAVLSRVKGIGRWSAEMYLMFALGRADIWPVGDVAVVVATQRLKRLAARPSAAEMDQIGAAWRPWRSAAALLMWHFYGVVPPGEWEGAG